MRIALIQMPYATTSLPSLGLSLLKACLERRGHIVDIFHFNLLFASIVGRDTFECIATDGMPQQDLLGEWTFSEAVWGADADRDSTYYNDIILGASPSHRKLGAMGRMQGIWEQAQSCRLQVKGFLDTCLDATEWSLYQVIGFTSMFEQTLASIAFAKVLRKAGCEQQIIFGGANCEGPMGVALLNAFDEIDAVCTGEGETAFPDYIDSLDSGGSLTVPRGMWVKDRHHVVPEPQAETAPDILPAAQTDLNTLPTPNYDAFFDQYHTHLGVIPQNVRITFESSRGCWWGQKNHCTFCGLNGTGMAFRSKTAARALAELEELRERYADITPKFSAADNIIPHTYFRDFLPALVERNDNLDIFYETKANLRKDQVELYRKAGLRFIQPGIESLDSGILKLMLKGVSALQNIQLLKWCREFGVKPLWNLLYGFPGEDPSAYEHQTRLVMLLRHLAPPNGTGMIRIDRFSPYFSNPQQHAISGLRPYPAYSLVFAGLTSEQIRDMAYFFDGHYPNKPYVVDYTRTLRAGTEEWIALAPQSALFHVEKADGTTIFDLRDAESVFVVLLKGYAQCIYTRCAAIITYEELRRSVPELDKTALDDYLDDLKACGLLVEEDGRFLGISLTLSSAYKPPRKAADRLRLALGNADAASGKIEIPGALIRAIIGETLKIDAPRELDLA